MLLGVASHAVAVLDVVEQFLLKFASNSFPVEGRLQIRSFQTGGERAWVFVGRALLVCVLFSCTSLKASFRILVILLVSGITGIRFGGFGLEELRDRRFHPAEMRRVRATIYDCSKTL